MYRAVAALTLSACLVVGAAGPARAMVTVSVEDGDTLLVATTGGDTVSVTCQTGQVHLNDVQRTVTGGCAGLRQVRLSLKGGGDTASLASMTPTQFPALSIIDIDSATQSTSTPDTVNGTQLKDRITADRYDTVLAGGGDDVVFSAGTVDAGAGDDTIDRAGTAIAGPGDDHVINAVEADGGDGYDVVTNDLTPFGGVNGAYPLDYVVSSTGLKTTTNGMGFYDASAANFEEHDLVLLHGYGLPQTVDSRTFTGRLVLHAYDGPDRITSGSGNDAIDAGSGNDTIDPGAGNDDVRAGRGTDTISVRDGAVDVVDCGDDADTVTADRVDVLTACENVLLPAPDTTKITGAKLVTRGQKAQFEFGSTVAGSSYECRVDKGQFKACTSPFKLKTKKLKAGKHTLEVRAIAGTPDPTPESFTFKVKAKPKAQHR